MKKVLILVFVLIVVIVGTFFLLRKSEPISEIISTEPYYTEVVGYSVENKEIGSYVFGNGSTTLLFVGGIHGGYEWNSIVLAEQVIDYLKVNSEVVPSNLKVVIIPNLNPDATAKSAEGRFNKNGVDLNRNFDCKWKKESTWQNRKVSAGAEPFSEPEARSLRDFILKEKPSAVVFWHSAGNAVYASECENGILPETLDIMNTYAEASQYKAIKSFDAYPVTGDAEGWLAKIGIPSITVELKTHNDIEFEENLAGVRALFKKFE